MNNLDDLIRFYENLTVTDVARFGEFYGADAYFKDPFNEVRGLPAIQRVFTHMFRQVAEPRRELHDRAFMAASTGAGTRSDTSPPRTKTSRTSDDDT